MSTCPHCSKELTGFVDQATLVDRLKSKDTEIAALSTRATAGDAAVQAKTKLEQDLTAAQKLAGDWQAHAAKFQAIVDPQLVGALPFLEQAYTLATQSLAADKRPALADWLRTDEAKNHPFVGHIVAKVASAPAPAAAAPGTPPAPAAATPPAPGATPPVPAPPAPGATPPVPAPTPPAVTPPARQGPMSAGELAKYFSSPEYRRLPLADQRKKREELEAQVAQSSQVTV